ncbi:hypothetical protein HDU96_005900 [Phlyctochytrium bullatum]|nr:hypothetical protein HDU96_005900 [Phlyctochytrium bullatum]
MLGGPPAASTPNDTVDRRSIKLHPSSGGSMMTQSTPVKTGQYPNLAPAGGQIPMMVTPYPRGGAAWAGSIPGATGPNPYIVGNLGKVGGFGVPAIAPAGPSAISNPASHAGYQGAAAAKAQTPANSSMNMMGYPHGQASAASMRRPGPAATPTNMNMHNMPFPRAANIPQTNGPASAAATASILGSFTQPIPFPQQTRKPPLPFVNSYIGRLRDGASTLIHPVEPPGKRKRAAATASASAIASVMKGVEVESDSDEDYISEDEEDSVASRRKSRRNTERERASSVMVAKPVVAPEHKPVLHTRMAMRRSRHDYLLPYYREQVAQIAENLVPIKLDLEFEGFRLRDNFMWNLKVERFMTPQKFVELLCEDLNLSVATYGPIITDSIKAQLQEHMVSYQSEVPPEEDMRISINLDLQFGTYTYRDRFEWDLSSPLTPEEFAKMLAADLGLGGEFAALASHAIHEQLQRGKMVLAAGGDEDDGSAVMLFREATRAVGSGKDGRAVLRQDREVTEWGPVVEAYDREAAEAAAQQESDRNARKARRDTGRYTANNNAQSPYSTSVNVQRKANDDAAGRPSWREITVQFMRSRLMVKNLPKHITVDRFREHFASKGEVTDAKLAFTKDGKFRQFGFIGYRTAKEAKAALRYFNNTFIDTSKIQVMEAKSINDPSLPRPWSGHSEGSTAYNKRHEQTEREQILAAEREARKLRPSTQKPQNDSEVKDPRLAEYLSVYGAGPRKTWANDDGVVGPKLVAEERRPDGTKKEVMAVRNRKPGGEGMVVLRSHMRFDESAGDGDERHEDDDDINDMTGVEKRPVELEDLEELKTTDAVVHNQSVSDLDYFRSRMAKGSSGFAEEEEDDNFDETSGENMEATDSTEPYMCQEKVQEEADGPKESQVESLDSKERTDYTALPWDPKKLSEEKPARAMLKEKFEPPPASIIAETGRLFVRNLAYTCTREELEKLFAKYGPLSEVHISVDKESKKPRGYAFVLYLLPEHAVKAYSALDKKIFQGRILDIIPAKERQMQKESESTSTGGKKTSFKKERESARRKDAQNDAGWNALFLNSDAVAEAISRKLGISKSEILDPSSDSMAVRLSIAETQIIAETKEYFEQEGIDLEAFSQKKSKDRSTTIILVKNLMAGTTADEIIEAFGKFGTLGRVLVPPSGVLAIVEYLEENEAKVAFRRLAYTKFKGLPLYLEWGPTGVFVPGSENRTSTRSGGDGAKSMDIDKAVNVESEEKIVETIDDDDHAETDAVVLGSLFVKNLNFSTTEQGLRDAFADISGLRSVRIQTKVDSKGQRLSMGFGFIEFSSKESARQAMKVKQGYVLDGHALQLKLSDSHLRKATASRKVKKPQSDENDEAEGKSRKLTDALFSAFGQVKTVRLPKKFDGTHRGFCFVEFLTKQEALDAKKALASTHLYGRHLVIEWAEQDSTAGSVEALRKRTQRSFFESNASGGDDAYGDLDGPTKKRMKTALQDSLMTAQARRGKED